MTIRYMRTHVNLVDVIWYNVRLKATPRVHCIPPKRENAVKQKNACDQLYYAWISFNVLF